MEQAAIAWHLRAPQSYTAAAFKHTARRLRTVRAGRPWLSPIGRAQPRRRIWNASALGDKHHVESQYGKHDCGDAECATKANTPVHLTLEALSVAPDGPLVFAIENLLSAAPRVPSVTLSRADIECHGECTWGRSLQQRCRVSACGHGLTNLHPWRVVRSLCAQKKASLNASILSRWASRWFRNR